MIKMAIFDAHYVPTSKIGTFAQLFLSISQLWQQLWIQCKINSQGKAHLQSTE